MSAKSGPHKTLKLLTSFCDIHGHISQPAQTLELTENSQDFKLGARMICPVLLWRRKRLFLHFSLGF